MEEERDLVNEGLDDDDDGRVKRTGLTHTHLSLFPLLSFSFIRIESVES